MFFMQNMASVCCAFPRRSGKVDGDVSSIHKVALADGTLS